MKKNITLEDLPELMSVQQFAQYYGVSRNTAYSMCKRKPENGGLRSFKSGNTRRIRKSVLINWIAMQEAECSNPGQAVR